MLDVRATALAQASEAIDRADESGAAFVIIGDAGIGKSTVVERITDHARSVGVPVVTTRWSGDNASPPMWSWSVLFRNWAAAIGPIRLIEEVHPLVRRLAPDVVEAAGYDVPDASSDELAGRYLVGDGLGRLFARATGTVLVVLEDLHHAPPGGLGLLASFAAAATEGRAVIVATSRDTDSVGDLTALPGATRIDLVPLDDADAETLVRRIDPTLADETVGAVVDRAEGNPFFLSELARLAATTDAPESTTPAVRDVVLRRVDGLVGDAREVLAIAALLGRKPDLDIVAAVVGDADATDTVIDDAERARLVSVHGNVVRFSHDLVRDALVDSLRSQQARRLHTRIAKALQAAPNSEPFQLAHHLLASGAATAEAADVGERAAAHASAAGAHEDTVRWADRTLAVVDRLPDATERQRRLHLLAGKSLVGLGDHAGGKERLVRSARASLAVGDGPAAAEALLCVGAERLGGLDAFEPPMDAVDAALALLDNRPDLRVRLFGRSADLLPDKRSSLERARHGAQLARELGDPDLIITAVGRQLVLWRDVQEHDHDALFDEIDRLAPAASAERQFEAAAFRCVRLLERGDVDQAGRLVPHINAGVLRLALPSDLSFERTAAMIHMLQGRFDEAEDIVNAMAAQATEAQVGERTAIQASFLAFTSILRGDFGELLPLAQAYLQMTVGTPSALRVHAFLALAAAIAGETEVARESIAEARRFGIGELEGFFFAQGRVLAMLLAEAACLLGDAESAAQYEPYLEPYAGRMPVGGMAPSLAFGAADHVLALIADGRGDHQLARTRINTAIALNRQMGAGPFVARSLLASAQFADRDGEEARVTADARQAARLATRFGMQVVAEQAAALLARHGAAPVRGARVGGAPVALVFTDIESSTQTAAALGDEAWLARLRDHDHTVRKLVSAHGGREIKHLGDGFMLAFPTASAAVGFTQDLQTAFADNLVRVRAGAHVGPVIEEDGDVFGTTVNVAARISAAAAGGETLVSDEVLALVPDAKTGEPRTVALKGVDAPMLLHPLA